MAAYIILPLNVMKVVTFVNLQHLQIKINIFIGLHHFIDFSECTKLISIKIDDNALFKRFCFTDNDKRRAISALSDLITQQSALKSLKLEFKSCTRVFLRSLKLKFQLDVFEIEDRGFCVSEQLENFLDFLDSQNQQLKRHKVNIDSCDTFTPRMRLFNASVLDKPYRKQTI